MHGAQVAATMRTTSDTMSSPQVGQAERSIERDLLPCGTVVGPWRIEEPLGAGGAGDVYAVVHSEIGKRAALKILRLRLSGGLSAERIQLEGQIVNRVSHPGIVDIFDGGTFCGRPYLVMERLVGVTLATLLSRAALPPALAIEILQQVCAALEAAHAAGVVHRDLKPENIFLLDTTAVVPQLKLIDWGIAKVLSDSARRTMEGQLIGTPDYLSPEQACGLPVAPPTDIYALGVLAYRMFCHCLPFEAPGIADVMRMHVCDPPPPPRTHWREMPASLEQLLLGMLAKAPTQRPTLRAVVCTLELIADELLRGTDPVCAPSDIGTIAGPDAFAPTEHSAVTLPPTLVRARQRVRWPITASLAIAAVAATGVIGGAPERQLSTTPPPAALALPAAPRHAPEPPQTPALPPETAAELPGQAAPVVSGKAAANLLAGSLVALARASIRPLVAQRSVHPRVTTSVAIKSPGKTAGRRLALRASTPLRAAAGRAPTEVPAEDVSVDNPAEPTAASVVEQYKLVGRDLARERSVVDVSDLWSRYRLLRIYEGVASAEQRRDTARVLGAIHRELGRRLGSALAAP
jgi:serine/threonine-protein kinase